MLFLGKGKCFGKRTGFATCPVGSTRLTGLLLQQAQGCNSCCSSCSCQGAERRGVSCLPRLPRPCPLLGPFIVPTLSIHSERPPVCQFQRVQLFLICIDVLQLCNPGVRVVGTVLIDDGNIGTRIDGNIVFPIRIVNEIIV